MSKPRTYRIADLSVELRDLPGMKPLPSFEPFAAENPVGAPDCSIELHAYSANHPPVPPEAEMELVSEDIVNRLYQWNGYIVKRTAMRVGDDRCMWTLMPQGDLTRARADVYMPEDWLDYDAYGNAFLFEKMLLAHGAVMLHCSLIDWNGKGVAFTAPSQTGKSTQARLWQQRRGARIINGDRAILRALPDGVFAYGSPWAGSSELYVNARVPLSALVVLAQAKENSTRALTHDEALRYFLIGTSLPMWDERLLDAGLAAIERILTDVPLYYLACTPDERAVEALEARLI
ncbi:MAG: hypothetical protein LBS72_01505 [Oscillospiraceae bacterium]|nr:hypothetical protein [Oscillospiraceae bacterium]